MSDRAKLQWLKSRGVQSAAAAAFLLGLAPVFGKAAIQAGLGPFALVAARTIGAMLLLLAVMLIFQRRNLYIYPVGLIGCFIAGSINGLGSILYYSSLSRIGASLGQLLFMIYPVFIGVFLYLDGQRPSRLTIVRLLLSLPAVYLLTHPDSTEIDTLGVVLMIVAAVLYAVHIPINQRILYEVPAPTVTLYTLIAMSAVVLPAYWFSKETLLPVPDEALLPLLALTIVTFFSRLALFSGVKFIGGIQTALIGLAELLVTIIFAYLLLGETLTLEQWIGAGIIIIILALGLADRKPTQRARTRGWLYWLRPPIPSDIAPQPELPHREHRIDEVG